MDEKVLNELVAKSPDRRSFVRKLSLAGAAVAAAGALPKVAEAQTSNDVAVLQFALNLEYLEAEFYSYAVTGAGIDSMGVGITGSGNTGATTGGKQVSFTDNIVAGIASELMYDELQHVVLLRAALTAAGVTPIAKPAINLAALGYGFAYQAQFLATARLFEEIGVTAYGGAAPLLSTTYIGVAARILAVEAEHVGAIRVLLAQAGFPTQALDGADVLPPPTGSFYFSTNGMALTSLRSPAQVLFLAYGGQPGATSGGFFPGGANGMFTTAAASGATLDGATITLTPNPITGTGGYGSTTVSWTAPLAVKTVDIRIGSPSGPLFTNSGATGSMATGSWVSNGTKFYLLDATQGSSVNSLGSVIAVATAMVR